MVAGIAGDIVYRNPSQPPRPSLYINFLQQPASAMTLVVRTAGNAYAALPFVQSAVKALVPTMPVARIETFRNSMRSGLGDRTMAFALLACFGGMALVLTVIGVYGVLSYFVTLQIREIGVRLALGSSAQRVLQTVLGKGMRLAAAGITIGAAASAGVAHLLASEMYGVRVADWQVLFAPSAFLLCVIVVACYLPARRAMTIDPIEALRYE
jgi:putative ABC transport system permease protein